MGLNNARSLGFFLLLLFPLQVNALTTINSLPYTCNIEGETYQLTGNLSSPSGTAITISADAVTLNGNDNTLTYASSAAGVGVTVGDSDGFEMFDIEIIQGAGGGAGFYTGNPAHPDGLYIHDSTFTLEQAGGSALYFKEASQRFDIELENITISVNHATSGDAKAIEFESSGRWVGGSIHGCTITMGANIDTNKRNSAISIVGGSVDNPISIYGNTLNMNYGEYGEGLRLWMASGVKFYSNTVNVNAVYSRGVLIDDGSDYCEIYGNTININVEDNSQENTAGIRIRGSSYGEYYNNTIDDSGAGSSWAGYPIIIGGVAEAGATVPSNNIIKSNIINYKKGYAIQEYVGGMFDNRFSLNDYNASGTAAGVYFMRPSPTLTTGNRFSEEDYVGATMTSKVFFDQSYNVPLSPHLFCASGLTSSNFSNGVEGVAFELQVDSCVGGVSGGEGTGSVLGSAGTGSINGGAGIGSVN